MKLTEQLFEAHGFIVGRSLASLGLAADPEVEDLEQEARLALLKAAEESLAKTTATRIRVLASAASSAAIPALNGVLWSVEVALGAAGPSSLRWPRRVAPVPADETVAAAGAGVKVGILRRERVAEVALIEPHQLHHGRLTPPAVLPVGDGLQVGGVDAGAIAAEVVNGQSLGDWTDQELVREPMRSGVCEPAVAVRQGARPLPAGEQVGGALDLLPEPRNEGALSRAVRLVAGAGAVLRGLGGVHPPGRGEERLLAVQAGESDTTRWHGKYSFLCPRPGRLRTAPGLFRA